jgi:hypothetical protein
VIHDFEVELHFAHKDGEPRSFARAEGDAAWHAAITLKWVYKVKKDEARAVIKHKVRLVACGFVQQEGVNFDDAFAPIARMESVRLLTLAA